MDCPAPPLVSLSDIAQKVAKEVARLQELTRLDLRDWMQVIAGYEKS
jgi:hypothetical protein